MKRTPDRTCAAGQCERAMEKKTREEQEGGDRLFACYRLAARCWTGGFATPRGAVPPNARRGPTSDRANCPRKRLLFVGPPVCAVAWMQARSLTPATGSRRAAVSGGGRMRARLPDSRTGIRCRVGTGFLQPCKEPGARPRPSKENALFGTWPVMCSGESCIPGEMRRFARSVLPLAGLRRVAERFGFATTRE